MTLGGSDAKCDIRRGEASIWATLLGIRNAKHFAIASLDQITISFVLFYFKTETDRYSFIFMVKNATVSLQLQMNLQLRQVYL